MALETMNQRQDPVAAPVGGTSRGISIRRLVRDVSVGLIIAGSLLIADFVATLVWQEPLTALIVTIKRDHISQRVLRLPRAVPHLAGGADRGRHRRVDDHVGRDVQARDPAVGVDHR